MIETMPQGCQRRFRPEDDTQESYPQLSTQYEDSDEPIPDRVLEEVQRIKSLITDPVKGQSPYTADIFKCICPDKDNTGT